MLPLLFTQTISTWFEWDEAKFKELRKHSFDKPILVVCYSPHCPHCSGLPQGTREYSDSDGNRTDVYVTLVNCEEGGCRHFDVTGTPKIVLVMGENKKYWPKINTRIGVEWNEHIDYYLSKTIKEVITDEELENATYGPTQGGTHFHIETGDRNNKILQEITNFSRIYRVFNSSFSYRIIPNMKETKLYAYPAPGCRIKAPSASNYKSFIEENNYGALHRYDLKEGREFIQKTKNYALYVVDREFYEIQKVVQRELAAQTCGKFKFGWIRKKDAYKIGVIQKINVTQLPMIVAKSVRSRCKASNSLSAFKLRNTTFFDEVITGKACGSRTTMSGSTQFVVFSSIMAIAIFIFSFLPQRENKGD